MQYDFKATKFPTTQWATTSINTASSPAVTMPTMATGYTSKPTSTAYSSSAFDSITTTTTNTTSLAPSFPATALYMPTNPAPVAAAAIAPTPIVSAPAMKLTPSVPTTTKPQRGTMYFYNPKNTEAMELLRTEAVVVSMDATPFGQGGCCEAFRVRIGNAITGELGQVEVAKRYRHKYSFLEEWRSVGMGIQMGEKFNQELRRRPSWVGGPPTSELLVSFLAFNRILEYNGDFYSVEEFLKGDFVKYNNIFGHEECLPTTPALALCCQVAAAFSHFTFLNSGHRYMILDVQGVGTKFTDVAVVSKKASQYGYTDTGPTAIAMFFKNHKCNILCRHLSLRPVSDTNLPEPVSANGTDTSKKTDDSGAPKMQYEWVDNRNRAHVYDEDTQNAIRLALKEGLDKVRISVGDRLQHIIDLKHMQQLSLINGEVTYVHARQKTEEPEEEPQPSVDECTMQLQLDDGEWHNYEPLMQDAARKAIREGKESTVVTMNGQQYELDFIHNKQRNVRTGNTRPIRFVVFETMTVPQDAISSNASSVSRSVGSGGSNHSHQNPPKSGSAPSPDVAMSPTRTPGATPNAPPRTPTTGNQFPSPTTPTRLTPSVAVVSRR